MYAFICLILNKFLSKSHWPYVFLSHLCNFYQQNVLFEFKKQRFESVCSGPNIAQSVFSAALIVFCLPECSSSSSSSPLLSLVTSTSEISHQPVHTYTTYI